MLPLLSTVLPYTIVAFETPQTIENTLDVVTREVSRQLAEIVDSLPAADSGQQQLTLIVAGHPDHSWLETKALQAFEKRSDVELVSGSANRSLEIVVSDLSTRYSNLGSNDSVERVITVALEGLYKEKKPRRIQPRTAVIRTSCLRSEAMLHQNSTLTSTQAMMPETDKSVFEEIIEPVIFVAAAVLTVVLAFSIRSK